MHNVHSLKANLKVDHLLLMLHLEADSAALIGCLARIVYHKADKARATRQWEIPSSTVSSRLHNVNGFHSSLFTTASGSIELRGMADQAEEPLIGSRDE